MRRTSARHDRARSVIASWIALAGLAAGAAMIGACDGRSSRVADSGRTATDSTLAEGEPDFLIAARRTGFAEIEPPVRRAARAGEQPGATRCKRGLPNPIEYYETHAQDFKDLMDDCGWLGWTRQRRCEDDPGTSGCAGVNPHKHTWARIWAIEYAHTVAPNNIPQNGIVIAFLQNRGSYKEAMYNLPARPRDRVYLVLEPGPAAGAKQKRAILSPTSGGGWTLRVEEVSMGLWIACRDGDPAPTFSYADFKDCSEPLSAGAAAAAPDSTQQRGGKPLATVDAMGWMSCAQGCCTSDYPEVNVRGDTARRDSGARTKRP